MKTIYKLKEIQKTSGRWAGILVGDPTDPRDLESGVHVTQSEIETLNPVVGQEYTVEENGTGGCVSAIQFGHNRRVER